ncbi:MAG: GNAT family N-acetyltransferase [Burkholderiales bacterium]|nr:GNAT family N-acetyltransferase [Burkholderiales bacterium]
MNFEPIVVGDFIIKKFRTELIAQKYIDWLNDPVLMKYSEQRHSLHDDQSCLAYYNSMQTESTLFLSIESVKTMAHIGNISVSFDFNNSNADLSILLGDANFHKKGVAKICWSAVINAIFRVYGIRRITAGTMKANKSMVNLMLASGMHIDSERPKHFLLNGDEVPLVTSAIYNPKFTLA